MLHSEFTRTSISDLVFEALNRCLETRRMVVVQGNSRIGKSTAAEAWANAHLGECRHVSLSGILGQSNLFRQLSQALGLASTYAQKAFEMHARVADCLQRSRLMLVIDEAHFLFPQQDRIYSHPKLIDWLDTDLCNRGVPVALIATPQFTSRLREVERRTGWASDQFKGRLGWFKELPAAPNEQDLFAVAGKLIPAADQNMLRFLVGYSLTTKRYFPAIIDLVEDARLLAKKEGRDQLAFSDIERARDQYRAPADAALKSALAPPQTAGRRRVVSLPLKPGLKTDSRPPNNQPRTEKEQTITARFSGPPPALKISARPPGQGPSPRAELALS